MTAGIGGGWARSAGLPSSTAGQRRRPPDIGGAFPPGSRGIGGGGSCRPARRCRFPADALRRRHRRRLAAIGGAAMAGCRATPPLAADGRCSSDAPRSRLHDLAGSTLASSGGTRQLPLHRSAPAGIGGSLARSRRANVLAAADKAPARSARVADGSALAARNGGKRDRTGLAEVSSICRARDFAHLKSLA